MFNLELDGKKGQIFFLKALAIVFIVRLTISIWLPLTADESYFVLWGKNPDYGYYDHTPFVGWLLAALLTLSDATWWLRLPSTLLPIFLSGGIYYILKKHKPDIAIWVALTFLVAPVNIINILITTDTPLVFFSFISVWYFYRAVNESKRYHDYFFAGLFLGLAFFSKYFAVFLGISYGLYILFFYRNRKSLSGLGLIVLMVVPFVLINLVWNYNNCWNNILFNLYNRTAETAEPLANLMKFALMLVYLFSPVLLYYIFKNKKQFKQQYSDKFFRLFIWLILIPLVLFLLISAKKVIGLHWLFSFYPFAFIAAAGMLSVKQWRRTFHFMWVFSLLHVIALGSLMLLPVETFSAKSEAVQNLTFGKYPQEVLSHLKPYEKDYTFATVSYGLSSVASYHARRPFIVFSKASFHARQDDQLTDYKKLDGKNILIFKRIPEHLDALTKYFSESKRKTFTVREVTFELLIGNGFNYDLYRRDILASIDQNFYSLPEWLPAGQCGFKNKYGF